MRNTTIEELNASILAPAAEKIAELYDDICAMDGALETLDPSEDSVNFNSLFAALQSRRSLMDRLKSLACELQDQEAHRSTWIDAIPNTTDPKIRANLTRAIVGAEKEMGAVRRELSALLS